jgi:hypothetical protein
MEGNVILHEWLFLFKLNIGEESYLVINPEKNILYSFKTFSFLSYEGL